MYIELDNAMQTRCSHDRPWSQFCPECDQEDVAAIEGVEIAKLVRGVHQDCPHLGGGCKHWPEEWVACAKSPTGEIVDCAYWHYRRKVV